MFYNLHEKKPNRGLAFFSSVVVIANMENMTVKISLQIIFLFFAYKYQLQMN